MSDNLTENTVYTYVTQNVLDFYSNALTQAGVKPIPVAGVVEGRLTIPRGVDEPLLSLDYSQMPDMMHGGRRPIVVTGKLATAESIEQLRRELEGK